MAIYNGMFCMGIIFMFQSYGIGQLVKSFYLQCDGPSEATYYRPRCRSTSTQLCDPYHVLMLTNVSVRYYNETEEQNCRVLGYIYFTLADCLLSQKCFVDRALLAHFLYRDEECSPHHLTSKIEYVCVSDSSILNMTKFGVNTNLNSLSLAYSSYRYPKIGGHFYCSCEITAGDDDVYIYTTVAFLRLRIRSRFRRYNTSVTIYSRDYTVHYDANNTDMTPVDHRGYHYQYLFYKQLNKIKGPIHLVYEGDKLPSNDKIWIDFKVTQGRLKVNCKGCKNGSFVPPIFNIPPSPGNDRTSLSVSPSPGNDQTTSSCKTNAAASSSNRWKDALISVHVIVVLLGLVVIGFVIYKKKRNFTKGTTKTSTEQPTISGPVSDMQSGTVSDMRSGTVSDVPLASGMYESLEMEAQPAQVYDSLEPNIIYENVVGDNERS
ncbi:hypothetical protein SNE40_020778 [Patella caerulea]|uniref:Uncharacterized protein n=1 Tax=Patella caerulea TaxID=87958 RepID=A0AAN8J4Z3_PATCE